jgi:hypothetical protein
LAKDKRRARILLEEGILDYIIWEVGRYLETINNSSENWKYPDVTPNGRIAAKQAAVCFVTLDKAHCAAIHTEGDLQLTSLYDRGIIPEERQVAQMLHEVPIMFVLQNQHARFDDHRSQLRGICLQRVKIWCKRKKLQKLSNL